MRLELRSRRLVLLRDVALLLSVESCALFGDCLALFRDQSLLAFQLRKLAINALRDVMNTIANASYTLASRTFFSSRSFTFSSSNCCLVVANCSRCLSNTSYKDMRIKREKYHQGSPWRDAKCLLRLEVLLHLLKLLAQLGQLVTALGAESAR